MSTGANPSRKRKYRPRNPPGRNRAEINWKEEEFQNLVRDIGFSIRVGCSINALGLPRITHFEFICRANRIEPTFEIFNVFYFMSYIGGFYSFNSRTSGVSPCSTNPPKSLHDWKQKFFYIHRGVIPIYMHYRKESQEWYKVLTCKVTSITQLEERVLVAAGMSMLWAPQNPRGVPVYGYQGKVGYSFMNVLDLKAGGAMIVAYLPEGRPVWLDQIRDRFLYPTSESLATYANIILGEDGGDDLDDAINPTREEVIVLSSEGSDGSHEGLIPRSTRAGPSQGIVNEAVNEPAVDDVETPVDTTEQLETRKKKRVDKSEGKNAEETVAEAPRKRPSNSSFLDYVVVSDDDATLTEIVKRKKSLEDKKKGLDEQATATLAEKKSRSQKGTTAAPSELEVARNLVTSLIRYISQLLVPEVQFFCLCMSFCLTFLLDFDYYSCSIAGLKPGKGTRKVDISKITPPMSPPSRTFDDVEVEKVWEGGGVGVGVGGGNGRGGGVNTEVESSKATPRHTIYTKRPPGSGGGGTSGVRQSPEYEHVQGGSWDTHNPACADLPHAPRWNLTQSS
ncbi:hypothetical protein Hanom_Chr09g00793171 [Helianthus anomalus]